MRRATTLIAAIVSLSLLAPTCLAQSHSPYAGFESRPIKALSNQQISELRSGLGMSLALAAELNGYPGPRHTIELAKDLELSADQRTRVEVLFAAMTVESVAIGEKLIAQEADLDQQFAAKTITPTMLASLVEAIGSTQAALRATHLKYHLLTLEILTPAQVQRYSELRGYAKPSVHDPARHHIQPETK
jgi:Spy/CpxP family protein refolding chaperone